MKRIRKRRSVPDIVRRALRQGLGVGTAVFSGYFILQPEDSGSSGEWLTCFKWAAITVVVCGAPVLGKVTQVSFERTIGTIAGGFLGYATVLLGRQMIEASDVAFTGTASAIVAFGAVIAGWALSLDYSAKLFVMTFLLVIMGADGASDAFEVMLTRVSGILLGVFLSVVLAMVIFPKSASHQATDSLAAALWHLEHLSRIAWNSQFVDMLSDAPRRRMDHGDEGYYVPLEDDGAEAAKMDQDRREAECEKVLMEVYNKLSKCNEFIPLAKSERYFATFRGRWCFLPTLPCLQLGFWKLPAKEMAVLATSIRKVARVLWALHVTFQEGFEAEVMLVLRRRYPPSMMLDLQSFSQAALQDMRDAFPDEVSVPSVSLQKFLQSADDLIKISDEQRRFIMNVLESQGMPSSSEQPSTDPRKLTWVPLNAQQLDIQADASRYQPPTASDVRLSSPSSLKFADEVNFADEVPRVGSLPGIALQELPPGPDLSPSASKADWGQDQDSGHQTPTLNTAKVDVFPQTAAGYISKVRWYSFQFLMQQLANEVCAMHGALAAVLALLPNALKGSRLPQ